MGRLAMGTWSASIRIHLLALAMAGIISSIAVAQVQFPAIDPSGNRIFLPAPSSTTVLGPHTATGQGWFGNWFGHRNKTAPVAQPPANSFQFSAPTGPPTAAFQHPADVADCGGNCGRPGCTSGLCNRDSNRHHSRQQVIPKPSAFPTHGQMGQIIMTPSKIVAPVGSEVIVLAGICGGDQHFVINQPLEWMISNDSVGQIIEVGGMDHPTFNNNVPPQSKKFDGQYAWGRTGLKEKLLTRGTPTPVDDIDVLKGQTYISLSSASAGTTYLTCVAPKAQAWDKRRAETIIHWVDGIWSIPAPVVTTSGTVQPLTTTVTRVGDGSGIAGWKVRYTIVGGVPAEFAPMGAQQAELQTGPDGQATVQLRQVAGKVQPGISEIRVDVFRPGVAGEQELLLESALTSVTWSAPALTIRTLGPRSAGIDEPFNYRIEITNPGDQISRNVVVATDDLTGDVQYLSSNPKPAEFGSRLEWQLGDVPPNGPAKIIDVQLKSDRRGVKRLCFEVVSSDDNLKTEACGETEIAIPCLGLTIDGPETARIGEQAAFDIHISNECEEPLRNVTLTVQYDTGLQALSLGNPITANVGDLQFGERKTIPLVFDVIGGGVQCFVLSINAEGGHSANSRRCIDISQSMQGQADIQIQGDTIVRAGNLTRVTATIRNSGNVPLETITILNRFSQSLDARNASEFPRATVLGDGLAFNLNRLEPGQSIPITVEYFAIEPDGNAFTQFTLTTPSGAGAERRFDFRIDAADAAVDPAINQPNNQGNPNIGIPADPAGGLQVSVEPANPVPADGTTQVAVRITVKNNRTVSDKNVDITLLIPPGTRIFRLDPMDSGLQASFTNAQQNEVKVDTRMELRAGEAINLTAYLVADQPGQPVVEVTATSDGTLGSVFGRAALNATPRQ